jgi:hypothetical protein
MYSITLCLMLESFSSAINVLSWSSSVIPSKVVILAQAESKEPATFSALQF